MALFSKKSKKKSSDREVDDETMDEDSIVDDPFGGDFDDGFADSFEDDDDISERGSVKTKRKRATKKKPAQKAKPKRAQKSRARTQSKKRRGSTASRSATKKAPAPKKKAKEEDDYAYEEELLDVVGFDADADKPQYYRKRPKRSAREWWIATGYKSAVIVFPLTLVVFGAFAVENYVLRGQLNEQISATYNPSLRETNADLGKSAIYAYYNGDPVPPVSVARGIHWPGGAEAADIDVFGESGDAGVSGEGVDTTVGSDADITASVRNLSLVKSQVDFKPGTEAEVRDNPAMEMSKIETLTYSGVFNGIVSQITIALQTPGAVPVEQITPADDPQPPILISVPTVTAGKPAVTGAPGTADPGTRGGEFEPLRTVPEPVMRSVDTWLSAYVADDRQAMRGIIQDPQDGNYAGMLGGWSLKEGSMQTQWQYLRTEDQLMAIGISFTATQAMLPDDDEDDPIVTDNPQMMEILVDFSNQGTPAVVAWGISGSAPYLEPYQNALHDNEVPNSQSATRDAGSASTTTDEDDSTADTSDSDTESASEDADDTSTSDVDDLDALYEDDFVY